MGRIAPFITLWQLVRCFAADDCLAKGSCNGPRASLLQVKSMANRTQRPGPIITTLFTDYRGGADARIHADAKRFFTSVALFEPDATVLVATSTTAAAQIKKAFPSLSIRTYAMLDAYQGHDRGDMVSSHLWASFNLVKSTILRKALAEAGGAGAWYMDADTFLLAPLPRVSAKVGLSDQRVPPNVVASYGRYNSGLLFVRSTDVLDVWEQAVPHARNPDARDQTALEDVWRLFSSEGQVVELGCGMDVGWYRFAGSAQFYDQYDKIKCRDGKVQYDGCNEEIKTMHYHAHDIEGDRMRPAVERVLRDCKHPALSFVLESYHP